MKYTFVVVLIIVLTTACQPIEKVSPVPEIEFKSFDLSERIDPTLENKEIVGELEISFIDGDADLGVYEEVAADTTLPDSIRKNLFLTIFEKVDGNYFEIEADSTLPDNFYTIPYDEKLDRVGQNKTVKGIIKVDISFFFEPPYDTMRYEVYIRDRALNKSNVVTTTDFAVKFD
ncbi:MAG: hypothetical protein JXJ22_09090 [Bacteroidales bacterium]|nr:hypothetical protein [Bacteroidales bacterium]